MATRTNANQNLIEFDEYHTPTGVIFPLANGIDFHLLSFTGFGMPPIEYLTQKGPFQHGETPFDYRLQPRVIQMVVRQNGCSRQEYWDNRAALMNILRPNYQASVDAFQPGKLRKILPDGSKRDLDVLIQQGPAFTARNGSSWDEWSITEAIRFIAHDPVLYDPTQVCTVYSLSINNQLVFDIPQFGEGNVIFGTAIINDTATLTYTGTWKSFPEIEITGPLSGPIITNETTGKTISLSYTISAGETVTISLQYGNKTVTSSVSGNIVGTVYNPSDFATFAIEPAPVATNGQNVVRVIGDGADANTAINLAYYTRYIGI